jgi:hypothetical protein
MDTFYLPSHRRHHGFCARSSSARRALRTVGGRVARASVRLFWVVAQASGTRSQVRSSREGGAVGVNGE